MIVDVIVADKCSGFFIIMDLNGKCMVIDDIFNVVIMARLVIESFQMELYRLAQG